MPVEELAAIVGVEVQDREGQTGFDLGDAHGYHSLAAIRHRTRLSPLGVHVGNSNAPAKLSGHALTAVSYRIGFNKAWPVHIPMFSADGDLAAQECARARPAVSATAQRHPARPPVIGR
jgi:hypothetical protein